LLEKKQDTKREARRRRKEPTKNVTRHDHVKRLKKPVKIRKKKKEGLRKES